MNILKLFKGKNNNNKQTTYETIPIEESDIFSNMTKHQLQRLMRRIELELAEAEKKEEELKASDMPF